MATTAKKTIAAKGKTPAKAKPAAKAKPPAKGKTAAKAKTPAKATIAAKGKTAAKAKPAAKPKPAASAKVAAKAKTPAKPRDAATSQDAATSPAAPPNPAVEPAPPPLVGIPSPAADRHRLLVEGEQFGPATLSLRPLAPLRLTSGAIVTCDPFEVAGPVLGRRLRPGSYDVAAAVATYPGKHGPGEQLLAAVIVKVSDARPTAWEPAAFAHERDAADPAYPTSSGAGCFMDARVQAVLAAEPTTFPTASYRTLERQLLDDHHAPTWGWGCYTPEAAAPAGCVAFLGGATEARRSYWGLDDRGQPACLLTDLEIFPADTWQR